MAIEGKFTLEEAKEVWPLLKRVCTGLTNATSINEDKAANSPNVYLLLYGAALVNDSEAAFRFAVEHLNDKLEVTQLPSLYADALKQTDLQMRRMLEMVLLSTIVSCNID